MKIYFSASISQMTEKSRQNCERIIHFLEKMGHTVFPEKWAEKKAFSEVQAQSEEESMLAQRQLTKLKKSADLVIVEVSLQSFGLGQEIAQSLTHNKPVIALFEEDSKPHLLRDEGGDLLLLSEYNQNNLEKVIEKSLDYASSHQDVRFNFFISPKIVNYMDWVYRTKKIPRSVYLRNLIEKDLSENKEYED